MENKVYKERLEGRELYRCWFDLLFKLAVN